MRSLLVLSLVATLLLLPNAQAAVFAEADGTWYWGTKGYVSTTGLPGVPSHATIFVDEGLEYYRVSFGPFARVYLQCTNGEGFLFVTGVTIPTESCGLLLQGAHAIPRAQILAADLGQLPGTMGGYLGDVQLFASGSGSYRIA